MRGFASTSSIGSLSSAPDLSVINTIYQFVRERIADFLAPENQTWTGQVDIEDAITHDFCLVCEARPHAGFHFLHQAREGQRGNEGVDFAVFLRGLPLRKTPLVRFEAKRLDSRLDKARAKEYVVGQYKDGKPTKNSGGIERFKNETHGQDVSFVGFMGYMQTDSFETWEAKVNGIIQEEITHSSDPALSWSKEEVLSPTYTTALHREYETISTRKHLVPFQARHFWLDLCQR